MAGRRTLAILIAAACALLAIGVYFMVSSDDRSTESSRPPASSPIAERADAATARPPSEDRPRRGGPPRDAGRDPAGVQDEPGSLRTIPDRYVLYDVDGFVALRLDGGRDTPRPFQPRAVAPMRGVRRR